MVAHKFPSLFGYRLSDEFVTPLSSPPSETAEDSPDGGTEPELSRPVPPEQLSDALRASVMELQNDPYDRYVLSLSDLQVLVGKVDENWREAVRSGRSRLHLLDKFTLSVRIQRMLNFSPEALEPNLSLAASLPSLSFHVDEQKVGQYRESLKCQVNTKFDETYMLLIKHRKVKFFLV